MELTPVTTKGNTEDWIIVLKIELFLLFIFNTP